MNRRAALAAALLLTACGGGGGGGGGPDGGGGDPSVCRGVESYPLTPLGTDATHVIAADFDGDGLDDAAWYRQDLFSGETVGLHYALALGGGAFATPVRLDQAGDGHALFAADMNADGHPDLVYTRSDFDPILFMYQPASADFVHAPFTGPALPDFDQAVPADLDGDGHMDLMLSLLANGSVPLIVHGSGPATFDQLFTYTDGIMVDGIIQTFQPLDLTGDGRMELVMLHGGPNGSDLGIGVMDAVGFSWATPLYVPHAAPVIRKTLLVEDMDADGTPDLLWGRSLLRGQGGTAFGAEENVLGADNLLVRDLDLDGHLDLVSLRPAGGGVAPSLSIRYGTGPVAFEALPDVIAITDSLSVAAGNFDGERGVDLIVDGHYTASGLTVLRSRCAP